MKNSKFLFVPMLATSVFLFTPSTASAEEGAESTPDTNIEENPQLDDKNTYDGQTSAQQPQVSETGSEDESVESAENQQFDELPSKTSQQNNPTEETSAPPGNNSDSDNTVEAVEENTEALDSSEEAGQGISDGPGSKESSAEDTEETVSEKEQDHHQKVNTTDAPVNKDTEEESAANETTVTGEENSDDPSEESLGNENESRDTPDSSETKAPVTKDNEETVSEKEQDHDQKVNTADAPVNKDTEEESAANETTVTGEENSDDPSTEISDDEDDSAENDEQKTDTETNASEDDTAENEKEKETKDAGIHEIQTLRLSSDKSIKMYSFDTKAKNNKPVVTKAQYAARFTDGKHSGLYSPVTSSEGVSLDFMDGKTVYITQKAVHDGTTYYRVHKNYEGAMQGWVKEKDLRLFHLSDSRKHTKDYAVSRDNEYLLTNPWGTDEQMVKRLDKYDTRLFRAEDTLNLGALTFYYGKIGDDYGWLADSRLKAASSPKVTRENYAAKLNTNKNSGLYSPVTSRESHSLNFLKDKTLYITQKADYNGTIFYRVHQNYDGAMQGWIQKEDLDLWSLGEPKTHRKEYSIARKNEYLLTNPWGSSTQTVKKLSAYGNSLFKAEKELDLGVLTYYYGKIGNDYGWLEETRIKDATPVVTSARFAARVDDGNNSGIYSPVTSKTSKKMGVIEDQTLYITQKATYNGTTFYRVHSNLGGAMQGWIKEKDLTLYRLTNPTNHTKKYTVARKNDYLLTNPWGTSYQRVSQLSKYGNQVFQAQKSLKLGLLTFHYGKIGNDYGWIQDNRLKEYTPVAPSPSVKTVKYNQSFNQVLNTQMNLRSKPQAWVSGGGWRNATRSEVANFLDTSHQTSETWMYTFLDLDRSQNIASSTINSKLLNGKGTLNQQGSAFLNASKTHGINEVYLISHALHETGNGTSTLAQGVRLDSNGNISSSGKKYYNMYGIAAYDHNAVLAGARYAQQMGWDTPAKAIVGGARFISQSYFNRGQTTLYSMRWNPVNPGTYQYATDVNWAYATAQNLRNYYRQLGIRGQYYTKHIF
ncbi:GW dipeptide domain-containing protein [Salinicoccus carnicancri]|uniref:GW dipeptide domain-containing protein n=1 Tax=Salinicoccus carnicancri TaxID=558170 RepID=UPI0003739EB0|nr:GW dipeptide domain-containing protein [Salinicoccus carnicancri]